MKVLQTEDVPTMTSELGAEKWAVVSDRGCEATSLTHEDARRLVHKLGGEGRHGLCIMSNDAASRISPENAKAKSRRSPQVAG